MKEDKNMMNEKMIYESPELEVVTFDSEDIITTSPTPGDNETPGVVW